MPFINWYSLFFSKCKRLPVSGHWPLFLFIMYTDYLDPGRKRGKKKKKKDFKEIFKSSQPGSSLKNVEWWISIFPCTAHTINTFVIRFIVKLYELLVLGKLSFRVSFCYNVLKRWSIEKKEERNFIQIQRKTLFTNTRVFIIRLLMGLYPNKHIPSYDVWIEQFFPSLHEACLFVSAQGKNKWKETHWFYGNLKNETCLTGMY